MQQSRAVWRVDPPTLMFVRAGQVQTVRVTNTTSHRETLAGVSYSGDASFVVDATPVEVAPGATVEIAVRFEPATSAVQMANAQVLAARDTSDLAVGAELTLAGMGAGATSAATSAARNASEVDPQCGVAIEASSPTGEANSIDSALESVGGTWGAILTAQQQAVGAIRDDAGKPSPHAPRPGGSVSSRMW